MNGHTTRQAQAELRIDDAIDDGQVEEDSFSVGDLAGDAHAVLDALRTRLLDLTLINRVLNFKPDGPRVVRVIDELPDQLFERLRAGAELELLPVSAPPQKHTLHAKSHAPAGKKERRAAAEAYAKELKLNTSYELPRTTTGSKVPDRHQDDAIQTLLFPSDLEADLRTLLGEARSAIEEKGSNILYLVFGLLEWYEREDSNKKIHSPLVMLPVSLRRGDPDRKTGAYRFFLSSTDEDVLSNISLQEKLRRDFRISLPEIGDEETPEQYLDRLDADVALPPRWKVCRQVALGLLSFTKLFMFRDLDPRAWPAGTSPTEHPLLLDLFGGSGSGDEYAGEYDFEGGGVGEAPKLVPPIIVDADSSQHSAIVDAMQGRSLVVEGPPGTGKSQTIANLIAAALADGKSVLFVADKLTALKVVSKRLEDHGLGVFCLELHSDKTQKSRLMDDIRKRLDVRGKLRPPAKLDERLQVLQETRANLNAYAQRMNTPFGAMGWTIHEILWGTQRRRSSLGADAAPWGEVVFQNADRLTHDRYEALRRSARTYSQVLAEVRPAGAHLAQHPFYGVWPREPRPDAEENIARTLQNLVRAAQAAADHVASVSAHLGGERGPNDAATFAACAGRVHLLGQAAHSAIMAGAEQLKEREAREILLDWCAQVQDYWRRRAHLDARIPDPSARELLRSSGAALLGFSPYARVENILALPHIVHALNARLAHAERVLGRVATWLGQGGMPSTLEALSMTIELLRASTSIALEALAFRTPSPDDSAIVLDNAAQRAAELLSERASLAEHFHLDLVPDEPSLLEAHAATCATAGFFSFFSGTYRAAKRQFAVLAKAGTATNAQMAAAFQALVAHVRKLRAFSNDTEIQRLLGPAFRGLETNFDAIRAARDWQVRVGAIARKYRPLAPALGAVATASVDRIRELVEIAHESPADLADLLPAVKAVLDLRSDPADASTLPLTTVKTWVDETGNLAGPINAVARAIALPPNLDLQFLRALREELEAVQHLESALASAPLPRQVLGPAYAFPNVPVPIVEQTVRYSAELWAPETPIAVRRLLLKTPNAEQLERLYHLFLGGKELLHTVAGAEQAFFGAASITPAHWYERPGEQPLEAILARASRALQERHALAPWLAYLRGRLELWSAGGDQIREVVELAPHLDITKLDVVAELLVFSSLARRVFDEYPELRRHEGFAHTNVREQFRNYDVEIMRLQREQLAARIDARPVPEGVKGASVKSRTELALLNHELGKQRAHIPIRQLVNRAGGALRALKPCFMMSPRSVAQYLSPGQHQFDLVIMDEASQLRPEDAMGAIARGKQAVIVGDSKQLPPTSFFAGMGGEEGEEEFIVETKESILDLAKTAFKPVRQLRWHYRSRHGSLIAFSNREYYDNNLIVFPSPSDGSNDLGVKYVEVTDGVCVSGVNKTEAERVADAVLEHLRTRPNESFGVVAMNVKQRQCIEGLIYERLKDQPELRKLFDGDSEGEAPFIKNLEAVQGDERDVIFISVTYGPTTPGGRVPRTFGPLNQSSGWRRLNVLFTRAKKRIIVFSSFGPEQLEGGSELSRGANDLRKYLSFARTGHYLPAEETERSPDSDFEVEVAEVLRDAGYQVVPQVGVAGYFIDLAVKHPVRRTEYILGVECDGAAYHSSFSARDRDRLRQQVLEGLGWKIHRIWSTDWFRDPAGQKKRLVETLKALA